MSAADPIFRRERGRIVALLARRVGVQHLEAVEDAVQSAVLAALERWPRDGLPDQPAAWLYRAAQNQLWSEVRRQTGRQRILDAQPAPAPDEPPAGLLAGEVGDETLGLLFVCADDGLPADTQLVLALKVLGGFTVSEIAERLFTTEVNVYKRLSRARLHLRERPGLTVEVTASRLPSVQRALYVWFTEGHLSSHPEVAVRRELCAEALRLTLALAAHPVGDTAETCALLALMHLHGARLGAREDGLASLEEQDRSRWDRAAIERGLEWLVRSARGDRYSRYHAEAAIAAEHCLAPSFAETRWDRIAEAYALLERLAPSPLHRLNRAVAVAEAQGPEAGLAVLDGSEPPTWLAGSYLWSAVRADLHRRAGHTEAAARFRAAALRAAPSDPIRAALTRRLDR